MSVKEKITSFINEHGIASQADLARRAGCSRERVRQIMNRDPALRKAYLLYRSGSNVEITNKRRRKFGANRTAAEFYSDTLRAQQASRLAGKKSNARQRGIEFDVQYGDLYWPDKCPILGLKLDYFAEGRQENSPSFDRLDPSRGYVKGNVVVVSWRANRIKNDGTADEHRQIAAYLDKALHNVKLVCQA